MSMRRITQKELEEIIKKHGLWLENHERGERAVLNLYDLSFLDLSGANLCNADLRDAKLCNAELWYANFCNADLRNADLHDANLWSANFCNADLYGANLCNAGLHCAGLRDADLRRANLRGACLHSADLYSAHLCNAELCSANFYDADLRRANLRGANLCNAYLCDAKLNDILYDEYTAFFTLQCSEEGSFIGYKEASGKIVKLRITENAKRSSATSRKCRCSEAEVLGILNPDRSPAKEREVSSDYDSAFIYRIGEMVNVLDFDEDRWKECSSGIHFFMTFDEAVQYKNA